MIAHILEVLVFQFLFLVVYDLFLRKETFFQWNRVYLLFTFIISLVLPWVEIDALQIALSTEGEYVIWGLQEIVLTNEQLKVTFEEQATIYEWVFLTGVLVMALCFAYKLYRIQNLLSKGKSIRYSNFTKVVMENSTASFSFFRLMFLGDGISKEKEQHILAHELVHIQQWHSLDLLFFELTRIVFWFNPMVYQFQNRITELHEFIADSYASTGKQSEQYQLLLSEVFQTEGINFTNQFFKKSLITKRIVMLTKERSRQIRLLRYLLPLALFILMVGYTSCETAEKKSPELESTKLVAKEQLVPFMEVQDAPVFPGCENADDASECFIAEIQRHVRKHFHYPKEAEDLGIEGRVNVMFTIDKYGEVTDIKKRGPNELLENEVVRIIEKLPKMQPGKHKGEVVNVPFSLPVVFKLN